MTSISLLLAPWHLLASHLFSLLLIWHSQGRWWMCVWKPVDKRLFHVSLCAIVMQKPPHGLKLYSEKHEEMVVSAGVCVQLSTGKMYWYNVLQYISLHEGNNKLASHWIHQSSDQMPSSCSRVPFDLYTSSLSFPSPPFSLVLLSRHGRSQVIWSHITCQRACELSLFMHWLQWESSLGAPRASRRGQGRSQRSWFQSYQLPWLRPEPRDFWNAFQESYRAHVCLWVYNVLYVRNVS